MSTTFETTEPTPIRPDQTPVLRPAERPQQRLGTKGGQLSRGGATGSGSSLRKFTTRLRNRARKFATSKTVASCGHHRTHGDVTVLRGEDGRASLGGLRTCQNVWACPTCYSKRIAEAGTAIQRGVVEAQKSGHAFSLLTLTCSHAWADDPGVVRRGLLKAWGDLQRRAGWRRLRVVDHARRVELTFGQNGWHPHIHVLVVHLRELSEDERIDAEGALWEAWHAAVVRQLGPGHAPSAKHGLDLRRSRKHDYLAKLGLELTDVIGKKGKGSLTPLQVLSKACDGDARMQTVWQQFCKAMKGCRMLEFRRESPYFKTAEKAVERELAERPEQTPIATIAASDWDAARSHRDVHWRLLEAAEGGGMDGVSRELARILGDPLAATRVRILSGR